MNKTMKIMQILKEIKSRKPTKAVIEQGSKPLLPLLVVQAF